MKHLAEEFVRERQGLLEAGHGWRVPEELRALAVRYGCWALDHGESVASAAEALGVSRPTLERWLKASSSAADAAMHEVVVREDGSASAGLTLVTPEGFRVEGLGPGELAALLRALR